MQVATLDIVIATVVLLSAAFGLVRGLVKEVLSLVSWALAFILAAYFSTDLAVQMPETWGSDAVRTVMSFGVIFIATLILAGVAQWLVGQLVDVTGLSSTDRLLGLVFGSARGLLIAIVMLMGLQQIASDAQWWHASMLRGELLAFEGDVTGLLHQVRDMFNG